MPVQAGSTVTWESDANGQEEDNWRHGEGWRLCWESSSSEPALTKSLQVLSLARNYIVGKTDYLEQESSLQTLLLSANYLSCHCVELANATNLGKGIFEEPSSGTLQQAGKVLKGVTTSNPFEFMPVITLPNIVLVFAGNKLMLRKAAILPPTESGRLLQEDEIEQGRGSLFPGHNNFILFTCCVLPGLVLFYMGAIFMAIPADESLVAYARSGFRTGPGSVCANHFLAHSTGPLFALAPIGLLCLIFDMVWSKGECIDFVIQSTIATVHADSIWQFLWVMTNCCASVSTTLLLVRFQRYGANPKHDFNQPQWTALICNPGGAATKHAIDAWRLNMETSGLSPLLSATRPLISWILHLPILIIAVAPSVGYVFALNVPTGSAWYVSLLGNSLLVTIVKMLISEVAFPQLARRLARLKFGVGGSAVISSYQLAVRVHRMEANSLLFLSIGTILFAPLAAVFVLDESCLRYYLSFVGDLQQVMQTWYIAEQGVANYRPGFCSRTLVVEFTWVWLQLVTICAFVAPALMLIHNSPKGKTFRALQASVTAWAAQLPQKIMGKSETQIDDPNKEYLRITVDKCAELKNIEIVSTSDPFVKLILKQPDGTIQEFKTAVKDGELNPLYKETFEFEMNPAMRTAGVHEATLMFEVWDKNNVSDDMIGQISYRLSELNAAPDPDGAQPITRVDNLKGGKDEIGNFGQLTMIYLGETVEQKALRTKVECCTEVLCRAETRKVALVEMYIVLLVLIAFGPLCPLLFLIAPICVSNQLSAISWVRSQVKRESYLQHLVDKVVVQHPTHLFSFFAVSMQWLVASSVFVDLQFSAGPVILYVVFWVVHLAVVSFYYLKKETDQPNDSGKQVFGTQSAEGAQRCCEKQFCAMERNRQLIARHQRDEHVADGHASSGNPISARRLEKQEEARNSQYFHFERSSTRGRSVRDFKEDSQLPERPPRRSTLLQRCTTVIFCFIGAESQMGAEHKQMCFVTVYGYQLHCR